MNDMISVHCLHKTFPLRRSVKFSQLFSLHNEKRPIVACCDINLRIKKGELLVVAGPNSSGKTTLLRILSTLILPDRGEITINGFDLVRQAAQVRNSVSYLTAEHGSFYGRLTGWQNLDFFSTIYNPCRKENKKKIDELIELLELGEYAQRMFEEYSSGIRQRIHLARGFLHDAPVVLLDEPTKNLDMHIAQKVRTFIRENLVGKNRKTVIMTSHILDEASEMANRLAIIQNGRIKACGSLEELRHQAGRPEADIKNLYRHFTDDK